MTALVVGSIIATGKKGEKEEKRKDIHILSGKLEEKKNKTKRIIKQTKLKNEKEKKKHAWTGEAKWRASA